MKRIRVKLALPAVVILATAVAPAGAVGDTSGSRERKPVMAAAPLVMDTNSRQAVAEAFLTRFVPAYLTPFSWTGNVDSCVPGEPSPESQQATEDTVNYVRSLAGLDPVRLDPALSTGAQEAALMMAANETLSHYPPSTWKCYTSDGAAAAARSNLHLSWGRSAPIGTGPFAVESYMDDRGDNNIWVGHRYWVLTPSLRTMGSGSTPSSNALQVIGVEEDQAATRPDWLPWPTAGYFPAYLEPSGRWSIATTEQSADLSAATVAMRGPAGPVATAVEYQDWERIVWRPELSTEVTPAKDVTYTVTISGILGGGSTTETYDVTLIEPLGSFQWSAQPTISGTAQVGKRLIAHPGSFSPSNGSTEVSYRWYREGSSRPVGYERAHEVTTEDLGKVLTIVVSPDHGGFYEGSASARTNSAVTRGAAPVLVRSPVVKGAAKVGSYLEVSLGRWSPRVYRADYRWFRDGVAIKAPNRPYRLATPADIGHRLRVRVTTRREGHKRAVAWTAATAKVARGDAPLVRERPTIYGAPRVGDQIVAWGTQWMPVVTKEAGQWFRSGKAIRGAKSPYYRVSGADVGSRLRYRVFGYTAGLKRGVAWTPPSAVVTR